MFWVDMKPMKVLSVLTEQSSDLAVFAVPVGVLIPHLLIAFMIPEIERCEREQDDGRRFEFVGFLTLIGTLAIESFSVIPSKYRVFAVAFAVVGWDSEYYLEWFSTMFYENIANLTSAAIICGVRCDRHIPREM